MATTGTYYFDGGTFASSSYLYTDAGLTTPAALGFYSIGGIVREVLNASGELGVVQSCPSCIPECSYPLGPTYQTTTETAGEYNHTIDVGADTGAIIVEVIPWGSNVGFTWTYNGLTASEYTNPTYGYLQGVIGVESPSTGDCSALPLTNALGSNGATLAGNTFTYNATLNEYIVGSAITLGPISDEASGGVTLTPLAPGNSYMVIPKPNANPQTIQIEALVTCANADFTITTFCPITLQGFDGTVAHASCPGACALSYTTTYYNVPPSSNPGPSLGVPSVNDWVFTDENAVTAVSDGNYSVDVNGVPHCMVVANGVITNLTAC